MLAPKSILTALVAALVVSSPPAQAASEDGRDAAKDVVSRSKYSDGPPKRVEPARRLGDVVRTKVELGSDLVITTTLRSLAATGHQEFHWTVVTSADEQPGGWSGSLVYNGDRRGYFTFLDPIAYDPECADASVDRPARTVTLTVPASCLGGPDWVRVGTGTLTLAGDREYQDDARRAGISLRGWKLGPKVTAS